MFIFLLFLPECTLWFTNVFHYEANGGIVRQLGAVWFVSTGELCKDFTLSFIHSLEKLLLAITVFQFCDSLYSKSE